MVTEEWHAEESVWDLMCSLAVPVILSDTSLKNSLLSACKMKVTPNIFVGYQQVGDWQGDRWYHYIHCGRSTLCQSTGIKSWQWASELLRLFVCILQDCGKPGNAAYLIEEVFIQLILFAAGLQKTLDSSFTSATSNNLNYKVVETPLIEKELKFHLQLKQAITVSNMTDLSLLGWTLKILLCFWRSYPS